MNEPEPRRAGDRHEPWDVIVVGAGPAGATAALHLADRGRDVLLVDRHPFPRDKACGDGLIPDALRCLARAGLEDRVREAGFVMREAAAFGPSRDEVRIGTDFVALKRHDLDALIVREAVSRGATLHRDRITDVSVDASGDVVQAEPRDGDSPLRARFALVATGADTSLLRRDGNGTAPRRVPSAVAVRRYIRSAVRLDHPILSFDREVLPGYAWIFPVAADEYNVGCGVWYDDDGSLPADPRAMLDRFLREFPAAREIADHGAAPGPVRGARLRCGLDGGADPVVHDRILAVGETIATTYPFSGEGIGKAMETAELAAEAVDHALNGDGDAVADYPRVLEGLRPRYRGYIAAQRWLSRPWICDLVVRRARRSGSLRRTFEDMLRESVDPRAVFSVRGMARALLARG